MKWAYLILALFLMLSVILGFTLKKQVAQPETLKLQTTYTPNPSAKFETKGSIPYWDQEKAFKTVRENPQAFNYLNLFWYFLTSEGDIQKYRDAKEDKAIIDFAHANNIKVFATITNLPEQGDWDSARVENILGNESLRQKHIADISQKLENLNFDGVIIDYESVKASERDRFSDFIKELSLALDKKKLLAVALHPKKNSQEDKKGIGAFQDWKALSQYADHLNIMAYGEHYDEGKAGPVASIPWLIRILNYATSLNIPREKLFLGVPLYGYDWNQDSDDSAKGLTFDDVLKLQAEQELTPEWDEQSQSPYFSYEEDGDNHEVWFENLKSIEAKINLAKQAGLAGITFWRLGGENAEIWGLISNN